MEIKGDWGDKKLRGKQKNLSPYLSLYPLIPFSLIFRARKRFFTRGDNFDADSHSAVRRIEDDNPGDLNQRKSASKRFTNRARR
jgi:hypothetical protein